MLFFVNSMDSDKEVCIKLHRDLKKKLEHHIKGDIYMSWKAKYIDKLTKDNEKEDLARKLEKSVIVEQQPGEHGTKQRFASGLECNFDKDLQGLYAEVKYWEMCII